MCKAWHRTVARHVEPAQAAALGANWRAPACSFRPVTPNVAVDSFSTGETSYRNVLCLKVLIRKPSDTVYTFLIFQLDLRLINFQLAIMDWFHLTVHITFSQFGSWYSASAFLTSG